MTEAPVNAPPAPFERSARRDLRIWLLLAVGLAFTSAGAMVDPATNCDEAGNCAPWLVPVAYWIGIGATMMGLGLLWANPRRGSRFDPLTGDLHWWQKRIGTHGGDEGRIHPSRISRLLIERRDESADMVHLYDLDGARLAYFDSEVVPWRQEQWAEALKQAWPHIIVEIRD
jgi:hypothetical protein